MRLKVKKYLYGFLNLLYPRKCMYCHQIMNTSDSLVCDKCHSEISYTDDSTAVQRFGQIECHSPLFYTGYVRDSLLRYKFHGMKIYSKEFSELLYECISKKGYSFDAVTWIPLSSKRLKKRGYDQAYLIASELAEKIGISCIQTLRKVRNITAQSATGGYASRKANVAGVYKMLDIDISGWDILLVDDIVTTGSTLCEAADELYRAGAHKVVCVTVARKKE